MQSVCIKNNRSRDSLTYGELQENTDKSTEVKVKISSCFLNRLDIFTIMGVKGIELDLTKLHILAEDFAEKVVEVEQKITDKKIRDRVLVNPGLICSKCENCLKDMPELCSNPGSN